MRKAWITVVLGLGALVSTALVGCQKQEAAPTPATAVGATNDAAHAAGQPASDKPKDHPAH